MIMVSPMGVEVDASEEHAAALLRDGWTPAKPAKAAEPEKPKARTKAKAEPKE